MTDEEISKGLDDIEGDLEGFAEYAQEMGLFPLLMHMYNERFCCDKVVLINDYKHLGMLY